MLLMIKPLVPSSSTFAVVAVQTVGVVTPVMAAEDTGKRYDIAPGDAAITLKRFAEDSGKQVVFLVDTVRGIRTNPLKGEFTVREALRVLVANTVLMVVEDVETGALMVRRTGESLKPVAPTERASSGTHTSMAKRRNPVAVLSGWLALVLGTAPTLTAADGTPAALGAIEGRVLNATNGEYVEKARVTVEGTTLEAFTQSDGTYRLPRVQAGSVQLRTFYTGLSQRTDAVNVSAGQTLQHDIVLSGFQRKSDTRDEVVKLDQMVVSTSKQMDGAAIAINEQRFASNIINVVSADEFGFVAEGNVGDFLKFLPGVTIDYGGGDARTISLSGAPSNNVPVTIGGFNLASAASSGTSRTVELEQVSINNLARVEIVHSPTPESPGSALAGSVNMVPRSAFERSKPSFTTSVFLMMKDNAKDFGKTPGPRTTPTRKIQPGFDFTYIVPVNKRFGFTLSGGNSTQYTSEDFIQNTWRGLGGTTTGLTATTNNNQYPDSTPDKPYLTDVLIQDSAKFSKRSSLGATVDYRLTPHDRVSFSFQYAYFDAELSNRMLTFFVNRVAPENLSTTFTHGEAGRGVMRLDNNGMRRKSGTTYMPTLSYRHDGPVWRAEAGIGLSHASNHYRDGSEGTFANSQGRRAGVTISFDDNFYLRPGRITVTDGATGAPVDPYNINNFVVLNTSNSERESSDLQRSVFGNLRRDLTFGRVPVALKAGFDLRQSVRDIRGSSPSWTFVGADGRSTTTPGNGSDDGAGVAFDENFSQRNTPFGFGKVQWVSGEKLWALYKVHPEYFSLDQNGAYRSEIGLSKRAAEVISSAYFRADAAFLDRRLKFVGGLRAEQTNVSSEGPLNDPTRNFQRDSAGKPILGANGRPLPIATDSLGTSRLTYLDRGLKAEKEYLRLFPNLNASYNLRENLIVRGSAYTSLGRPDYNQYAGGITLPDTENPPSPGNRITVNNVGIKAWSANSSKVRLEYYFQRVGQISVGAFRRDFKNFFGSTTFTPSAEFLELYDLDPSVYGRYDVSTQYNITSRVRMEGYEFDYKQALTFLPPFARGVQVFANASAQRATGPAADNFTGYVPRTYNWGASLSREKFNLKMNWNYRGRQRRGLVTGRGIEPSTYNWGSKRLYIDLTGDYALTKRITVFGSIRNLNNATEDFKIAGPNTPLIAQLRQRQDYGASWVFGVRGNF